MRPWLLLALGILFPLSAGADGSIGLRITDEGLDWIADQALERVPREIDLDDLEMPLMDCWPRDSALELWEGHVDIEHLGLDFPFSEDEVGIVLDAGAHVTGTVLVDALACLPLSVSCDVDVDVTRALASAALGIAQGDEGRLVASLGDVTLAIAPEDVDLELSNCTGEIDDSLDVLYDQAEPMLLRMIQEQLQSWVDENVRPRIDELLGQTLAFPVESAGIEATVVASGIERDNRALQVSAHVGLRALEVSTCITPSGEVELDADAGLTFTEWDPSPFALGISERVLDEALYASWQAGSMCFPPKDLSGFAGFVEGIPEGVELQISFAFGQPPNVDIEPDGVHLALDGLSAVLDIVTPDGPTRVVFQGGATALALLELDPSTNGLRLRARDLAIAEIELIEGVLPEGVDVQAIIDGLVFPFMLDFVGNVRVADAVVPASDFWVIVNAVDYYDGAAAMAFELFITPTDDVGRPDTIVVEAPEEPVTPGTSVSVLVGGRDDRVPERLLRYSILRPEDPEWAEPTFSPTFTIRQYAQGEFVYRIRAIDLAGNVDEDPAKITLVFESLPDLSHPDALPPPGDEPSEDGPPATQTAGAGGCSCGLAPVAPPASPMPGVALALLIAAVSLTRRWPRG
jgi:hypothetical protein